MPSSRKVFIRDLIVSVVIPECRSRESVFAEVVLFRNDRSPTKFLGDDDFIKKGGHPELDSGSTAWDVCCGRYLTKSFWKVSVQKLILIL